MEQLELENLIKDTVKSTISQLGLDGLVNTKPKNEKTAYQKVEQLLFNYNNFHKVVAARQQEIADLKTYGVPSSVGSVREYVDKGGLPGGVVLPEESVESAVANVQKSVQLTVKAISMIDRAMESVKNDPFYPILEMRYFEGRTLEDIANALGCTHSTISRNRNRLVNELALIIFPDLVVSEYLN